MKKLLIIFLIISVIFGGLIVFFATDLESIPKIKYGVSFNVPYAYELQLDWKQVYLAVLDDLKVKRLRIAAHWPVVEPHEGEFDWTALDFQIKEAKKRDAEVILAVGRRLPRWPECHVPEWARSLTWEQQKVKIKEYVTQTVERYKNETNILYWQIENEPFLEVFAREQCGDLDKSFLDEEIVLVKSLDSKHKILITDSGNLGTWLDSFKRGDAFGTSVYVYLWNPTFGPFKTYLPPSFYVMKKNIAKFVFGEKPVHLIELSLEPWLLQPIVATPEDIQLKRMDITKFNEVVEFAQYTNMEYQYLWGVEWWYWMKNHNHPEFWERAKEIFKD